MTIMMRFVGWWQHHDLWMHVRGERKKEQLHHHLLPFGASPTQTTSWPGVADSTPTAAATALAWLDPPSSAFHQKLLRAIPTTTTTLPTIAREGSQILKFGDFN
jgi:hypothetical protein